MVERMLSPVNARRMLNCTQALLDELAARGFVRVYRLPTGKNRGTRRYPESDLMACLKLDRSVVKR